MLVRDFISLDGKEFGGLRVRIAWWIGYEGALEAKSVAQKKFK
jgi:hypothetical protein